MIDFDLMVNNESMEDIILYLIGKRDEGISHPSLDRFFNLHKANEKYDSYNTKLIHTTKKLVENKVILPEKYGIGYRKGPNWKDPKFVTEKKYGIN